MPALSTLRFSAWLTTSRDSSSRAVTRAAVSSTGSMRLSRAAMLKGRALKRHAKSVPVLALTCRTPVVDSTSTTVSSAASVNVPDSRSMSRGCGMASVALSGVDSTGCSVESVRE